MIKTCPIGTKIRYIGSPFVSLEAKRDIGKSGVIVGYRQCGCRHNIDGKCPRIYLPESEHVPLQQSGVRVTWGTGWDKIELLALPNEQLVFSFME